MPRYPNWSRFIHKDEVPDALPESQGIYKLWWSTSSGETLQRIGQARNLRTRVPQYFGERWWNYCQFAETTGYSKRQREALEERLISRHKPPYNIKGW